MKLFLAKMIATGFYSGFGRPYPGTWGTAPAWLIAFFLIRGDQLLLGVAAVIASVLSVWSATEAEKIYGHDARKIVIDEWAGMFVALMFVPYTPLAYGLAFVAFRGFDVVKLWPAAQAERLPAGWGITMDDIAAGAQANVAVQIILWGLARGGYI
jgi:phosphatidylglycerophosphatase A